MIANVEAASEAMGLGGVGANKGVAAVSLLLGSTPLCFVGGHLAAHEGMEAKRAAKKDLDMLEAEIAKLSGYEKDYDQRLASEKGRLEEVERVEGELKAFQKQPH